MNNENKLKHYRKEAKVVKQVDMAHFMDLSNSALVSQYESGKKKPNLKTCIVYSVVLDTPLSELIPLFYTDFIRKLYAKTKELISSISAEPFSFEQEKRISYFNTLLDRIACLHQTNDINKSTEEETQ